MTATQEQLLRQADELYEQYGKPLEAEHWGEYVAIFPDGWTVLGSAVREVARQAVADHGRGSHVFRIGQRWVWKLRSPRISGLTS